MPQAHTVIEALLPEAASFLGKGRALDKIYDEIIRATDSGPFDGGCVLFARALQLRRGGDIWVLLGRTTPDGAELAQHAFLKVGGTCIDANGPTSLDGLMKRFERLEHTAITGARPFRDGDLPEAPWNPEAARRVASLLPEAVDVTASPEFKRWFAGSIVVDDQGRPLRVYHGTGADISAFDPSYMEQGNDQLGSGFYFTTSTDTASGYSSSRLQSDLPKPGGENANVIPAYLRIVHPINADTRETLTLSEIGRIVRRAPDLEERLQDWGDTSFEPREKILRTAIRAYANMPLMKQLNVLSHDFYPGQAAEFNKVVQQATSYDGVFQNLGKETHWVAWFPQQIKSAVGNRGTWDPESPNIID